MIVYTVIMFVVAVLFLSFGIAIALVLSGIVALFGGREPVVGVATSILVVSLVTSFVILLKVQRKLNQGLF